MLKNIYVPRDLPENLAIVYDIKVKRGDRMRRGQTLLLMKAGNTLIPIVSAYDAWVRYVAVKTEQQVSTGDLLLLVDAIETMDFRVDQGELNELGSEGRRGAERKGQNQFGQASGPLFDAPEAGNGLGNQGAVKQHPYTKNMKEGVPPKMNANAASNDPAIQHMVEEASNHPELKKQLSAQLQNQLSLSDAPSAAPTLSR